MWAGRPGASCWLRSTSAASWEEESCRLRCTVSFAFWPCFRCRILFLVRPETCCVKSRNYSEGFSRRPERDQLWPLSGNGGHSWKPRTMRSGLAWYLLRKWLVFRRDHGIQWLCLEGEKTTKSQKWHLPQSSWVSCLLWVWGTPSPNKVRDSYFPPFVFYPKCFCMTPSKACLSCGLPKGPVSTQCKSGPPARPWLAFLTICRVCEEHCHPGIGAGNSVETGTFFILYSRALITELGTKGAPFGHT